MKMASVPRIVKRPASITVLLILAACGSTNPYNVPEGEGAFLQNSVVKEGNAMYRYQFVHAEDEFLDPGLLSTKNVYYALYTIPRGDISVHVMVEYFYRLMRFGAHFMPGNYREIHSRMSFTAVEGETYQVACEVKNKLAYIWIEDAAGEQVSQTMTATDYYGYGLPDPAQ